MAAPLLAGWDNFFVIAGTGGLVYVGKIGINIGRIKTDYVPVREDWVWNVILPALSYGTLLAAALLIWCRPQASVYGIAAAAKNPAKKWPLRPAS